MDPNTIVATYYCGCDDASQEADIRLKDLKPQFANMLTAYAPLSRGANADFKRAERLEKLLKVQDARCNAVLKSDLKNEEEIERLQTAFNEMRDAEHALSARYLKIRRMLSDFGSFDTDTAPSAAQIAQKTENALLQVIAERSKFKNEYEATLAFFRDVVRLHKEGKPIPWSFLEREICVDIAMNEGFGKAK
jgi:small-conductance mechanosensitive channel